MSRTMRLISGMALMLIISRCSLDDDQQLFRVRRANSTGLTFVNRIMANDSINGITHEYIYNGGAVAVGDVNNDGLKDLFFSGNMVTSKLFLNRGDLTFEDVTDQSGVQTERWCTGTSLVDINNDGLLDIYVCVAGLIKPEGRRNIFFINQGMNEQGIPQFEDRAAAMGVDDDGYSTMGVFLDYDKDEDLDLYVLTNAMERTMRNAMRPRQVDGQGDSNDRFYRNNGDNTFTDVSRAAGILQEGYGLGIALCDMNQDGWTDIYCANDFISNDLLWINNHDGTFTDQSAEYFKHFSNSSMGMDIADFNNDALLDVMVLDMMPATNIRQKLMISYRNIDLFYNALKLGYHPQFMRNTLQLNQGKFLDGKYRFSEIGQLAGIYKTDWSWAPLLADYDNDGWKDLVVTNGYRKDVTNLDYIYDVIQQGTQFGTKEAQREYMVDAFEDLPDVKLPNHAFVNNRDLTFTDKSEEWGLNVPTFSNGTAFADLDDDGDLDLVTNNIDEEVILFENRLNNKGKGRTIPHYLTIRFDKSVKDYDKIGMRIWIYQKQTPQYFEYYPYRGYKSTMDPDIHVGLGAQPVIDSLIVQWPDGALQKSYEIAADTVYSLTRPSTGKIGQIPYISRFGVRTAPIQFEEISDAVTLKYAHKYVSTDDLKKTSTLIHELSKYGPSVAIGDINGDGLDDAFIGSDAGETSVIFVQESDRTFTRKPFPLDVDRDDRGALFFDADGDGDQDLYVVSGGARWRSGSEKYQDRLYLNNGQGTFSVSNLLPEFVASGSCVVAADYDLDGDTDLFIGGRLIPFEYPNTPLSYLLENRDGRFVDRSELLGATKGALGMVNAALWTDVNNDHRPDLIAVGEWMPIKIFINDGERFTDASVDYKLMDTDGWWNSVNGGDFDNDGDMDYVLGNTGQNSFFHATAERPVEIYALDFDNSGSVDPIMTHYLGEESYIVHPRNLLVEQIPLMKNRFDTFEKYGTTPFDQSFLPEELQSAIHLYCRMMQSVILENIDGREFVIHTLPVRAQFAPVFGTIVDDFNNDNRADLLLVGNSYAEETITGYYDASYGTIMINKGNFEWEIPLPVETNLLADGDTKGLARIINGDQQAFIVTVNDGPMKTYTYNHAQSGKIIPSREQDWYFYLDHGGFRRKVEIYRGSGYLSASTTKIVLPQGIRKVQVVPFTGGKQDK